MNAEQKQRVAELLSAWRATAYALHADRMADLLQELVDAPETEPAAHLIGLPPVGELQKSPEAPVCKTCSGTGECNDAEPGDMLYNCWACPDCNHSGASSPPTPSVPDELSGRFTDPVKLAYADGWNACREAMLATTPPAPSVPDAHPDDIAVDRFAAAMKAKMARSRDCGRYGWDDPAVCSAEDLRLFLTNHIAKGDPVDVGNFAMMLFNRGETTATKHRPEPTADVVRDAERLDWLDAQCSEGNGRHICCLPGGLRAAIDAARRSK